jgi:hypothetical protein
MNKQKWIILVSTLALIGGAATVLAQLRAKQKLGAPAVKTSPLPDPERLQVDLPERVLDYTSEPMEVQKIALDALPRDTSFGQRRYKAPDGFMADLNVVLMGTDRTSLHKPEFCLEGAGWNVDVSRCEATSVHMERPCTYDLPVMKLIARKDIVQDGQKISLIGIYAYWFVAPNEYTAHHWQRMLWMAEDLLRTGTLQRWAYISCFHYCLPGQEDAAFERMKKMIAASVPEFQLTPGPAATLGAAQ